LVYDGDLCRCGARGCLEAYIGADRITARLAAALGEPAEPGLLLRMLEADPAPAVAAEVLEQTVGYLGAGIADLINLFSPERIVIGGGTGSALARHLLPAIRDAAARHALRRPYARTSIEVCQLGPEAVAMGAATLPIARLLAEGGLPAPSEEILTMTRKPPVAVTRRVRG
jgi:predicted NBD/HSP70 family sugar kinase